MEIENLGAWHIELDLVVTGVVVEELQWNLAVFLTSNFLLMFKIHTRGMGIILLAIGFLSLLGTLSLVNNFQTLLLTRKALAKVFRMEGAYNSEMVAWQNYHRDRAQLALQGTPDPKGRYVASIEGRYDGHLPTPPTPEKYASDNYNSGDPLSLVSTVEFDTGKYFISHFNAQLLRVRPRDPSGSLCGSSVFEVKTNQYKTCLAPKPGVQPPPVSPKPGRLVSTFDTTCFRRKDGVIKCWGERWIQKEGAFNLFLNSSVKEKSYIPITITSLPKNFSQMSAGTHTICAIMEGVPQCWGSNTHYVISPEKIESVEIPTVIPGLTSGISQITVGGSYASGWPRTDTVPGMSRACHACAVDGGKVKCWGGGRGYSAQGTWGDNRNEPSMDQATPIALPDISGIATSVSLGVYVSCAVIEGEVYCWGTTPDFGDIPKSFMSEKITRIPNLNQCTDVAVGKLTTCAVCGGKVSCWGENICGELGLDPQRVSYGAEPREVSGLSEVSAIWAPKYEVDSMTIGGSSMVGQSGPRTKCDLNFIAPAAYSFCALSKGDLFCWGHVNFEVVKSSFVPLKVPGLPSNVVEAAAGSRHFCAATADERVYCWAGSAQSRGIGGQSGQAFASATLTRTLEDSDIFQEFLPPGKTMVDLKPVNQISLGKAHSCAVLTDGSVRCWGLARLRREELGFIDLNSIRKVESLNAVSAIAAGTLHTCVIDAGKAKCWGENNHGQLGDGSGDRQERYTPVLVSTLGNGTHIAAGYGHSCAVTEGSLKCWGDNSSGQLGNNSNVDSAIPVQVEGLTSNVTDVVAAGGRTCAIQNGAVKCWGQSYPDNRPNSNVPLQVDGLSANVTAISVGFKHACAIQNGALKCWGENIAGSLGSNPQVVTTAVQIEGMSSGVTSVGVGTGFTCAIASGHVKCWGRHVDGQLGLNDPAFYNTSVPNDVVLLPPNAASVAASGNDHYNGHACAIVEGKVYCWGSNGSGQVGSRPDLGKFLGYVHVPVLRPIID